MKHKWAKEIKAWADGAEIEYKNNDRKMCWTKCECPTFDTAGGWEYRIKPQPQYLYVYLEPSGKYTFGKFNCQYNGTHPIGKIKLEQNDEPT